MKLFFLLIAVVFCPMTAMAQQVQVLEQNTKEPVPGASIYNRSKTKVMSTDIDGRANLDVFNDNEFVFIESLLFEIKSLKKSTIVSNGNIVYLKTKVESLDQIVISASKFEQSKRDIPQKILNISAKDIKFSNPQTSADLLENTGNVYIQKSQLGGGSPLIRGFSTNRLLITVDGVRMNNAIFRGGNLQNVISIDPFAVQNTEITLGAGSIVYGSDAIGGVMSFYTKRPILSAQDSTFFDAGGSLRYATANDEKTANAMINVGLKNWAFLSNLSYTDFDDLRMGSDGPDDYLRPEYIVTRDAVDVVIENNDPQIQVPTGYDQINFMQKALFKPKEDFSLDVGLFYSTTSNYSRYDRLIRYGDEELRSAEWYYGPQKWFMGNVQLTKLSSRSNLYDKLQTTFAYQNFQESRNDRDFNSDILNSRTESVDAYSANLDLEKNLTEKLDLFYGLEYIFNRINSKGSELNIRNNDRVNAVTRYPDGSDWQSYAAYTSLKYKPSEKFILQSGIRYNYILANSDFTENNQFLDLPFNEAKIDAGALTGTLGFSYLPNELVQLKANLSSAFRAPNIDDIGKIFDSEPGSVVVPNPNLRPEYAYGGDIGFRIDINKKLMFDSSFFYTFLDDALVRRDFTLNGETQIDYNGQLSDVQAIQNASKANIYGFELGMRYNFSETFYLRSQYNIIRGTSDEEGVKAPVRHVSPDFGNTHIIYQIEGLRLDAFANYNAELSFNELAPSELSKAYLYATDNNGNPYSPSWVTYNLRTHYQFTDEFSIYLTLENIADKRYRTYSSGISAPGRNLILSLNYEM